MGGEPCCLASEGNGTVNGVSCVLTRCGGNAVDLRDAQGNASEGNKVNGTCKVNGAGPCLPFCVADYYGLIRRMVFWSFSFLADDEISIVLRGDEIRGKELREHSTVFVGKADHAQSAHRFFVIKIIHTYIIHADTAFVNETYVGRDEGKI